MKVINIKVISLVAVLGMFSISCAQNHKTVTVNNQELKATLIFEENFDNNLDQWQVEQMPKGTVEVNKSKLEIDDVSGCTVWLKEKFSGSIMIEYDVFMIQDGGPNDRVSDLNCFWMATDPEHPNNLFANSEKRGGNIIEKSKSTNFQIKTCNFFKR